MCLNPRYVTNRSLHWNLFQPLKLQVPCGKCEECKRSNRSDWFVRSYYEWQKCKTSTYFYTLTYNNEFLPKFDGIACFRKKDLQDFLKRLRFRLDKYNVKLKYLITCEYGELRNRSHYHALFFLSRDINPYWFLRFVTDSWNYGFVKPGDNVGSVSSDLGIQYVTKYITKDMVQLEKILPLLAPRVFVRYYRLYNYCITRWNKVANCTFVLNSDFTFSRKLLGKCDDIELEFLQKFLTKIRREVNKYIPFHLQSTKLGVNMIDRVNDVLENVPVFRSNGSVTLYKLPRYIKRLLWYDVIEGQNSHKKDTFVLNDAGKKHILDKIEFDVQRDKTHFEEVLLNSSKVSSDILSVLHHMGNDFKHVRDLVFWCQHFDLDLEVLSIYKNVFRGRVDFVGIDTLTKEYVKDSYKDVLEYHLETTPNMDFGELYKDSHLVQSLSSLLWNNNEFFQPYEHSLQILDTIDRTLKMYQIDAKLEQDKNTRKLRDLLNNV